MFEFNYLLRKTGIRRPDQLINPILNERADFEFPRNSLTHFISDNPTDVGPLDNEPIFDKITKFILIDHIVEIGDFKGSPKRVPVQVDTLIRNHRLKNKRYRQFKDIDTITKDPNSMIVYSYSLLHRLYRYARTLYSDYNKWSNIQTAIWKNANYVAGHTDRNQFIWLTLPKVLPSLTDLRVGSLDSELNQKVIRLFREPESRMLLEIWKWLGDKPETSMLSLINKEHLPKINLIIEESGKWILLNLGILNGFRKVTSKDDEEDDDTQVGLTSEQIQKRFLKMLMVLFETKALATNSEIEFKPEAEETNSQEKEESELIEEIPLALDDEDEDEENEFNSDEIDAQLDKDFEQLEILSEKANGEDNNLETSELEVDSEENVQVSLENKTLESGVQNLCNALAENGMITANEYKKHMQLSESYKSIKSPEPGKTLEEFIQIKPEDLEIDTQSTIPPIPGVIDKTMLETSLNTFDSNYVKNVMQKDVAAMVLSIQNSGVSVTSYEVEKVEDILGSYNIYSVRIVPVVGAPSTIKFKLPIVDEDGFFESNGTKYKLRKQKISLPIQKISPDKVALSSYYGKIFIYRSNKKVFDYANWLRNQIVLKALSTEEHKLVTNIKSGSTFNHMLSQPKTYSSLAMGFRSFDIKPLTYPKTLGNEAKYHLMFDRKEVLETIPPEIIKQYEVSNQLVIGFIKDNYQKELSFLVMDRNNQIYFTFNNNLVPLGTVESILQLNTVDAPKQFAELKVMGKFIPIGIILSHEMGIHSLLKFLKASFRKVQTGTRLNLLPSEYAIHFEDETLILSREDELATLIFAGFLDYKDITRNYSIYNFDKQDIYLNILESKKIGIRYLREIELLYQMFIDPITKEILEDLKEPTNFRQLLIRSCQLLLTDYHPHEMDPLQMRNRGYERMSGAVYAEMVKAIRMQRSRLERSRAPIEVNPHAVWIAISQDPSKILVSDINPIENLKQTEAITFGGTGGRSSRSMVKHTRAFHKNDIGVISEATVDSSDTGINTYTSANPKIKNLRGLLDSNKENITPAQLLSTSALMAPGSDRDDPKRTNFVSVQNSHTTPCEGYHAPIVRTGYEQVIGHRTSDLFCFSAKQDGSVISVSETGIVIQYVDGTQKGIELGRRFGKAAGLTIPHFVTTDFKVGHKFKKGDIVAYNNGFFERDILNPSNVVMKMSVCVKTALMESVKTFEDSSSISKRVSTLLNTSVSYERTVIINFKDVVRNMVKVGELLEPEDILCIIEDEISASSKSFDEETILSLKRLSAHAPKSKYKGKVERITAYYFGEKEDMSDSLREICNKSDKELVSRNKSVAKKGFTGQIDEGFRVDGDSIPLDSVAIQFLITTTLPAGTGD